MASLDDLFNRAKAGDPDARVISVRGAREHNLKNVDSMIPRDQLVVFTGLSGSGKSSLAFDTIYAEGQRRYVESLSAYARQFLEMMQKPDVDQIDGLSPAISIEQKTTSKNPRSTVGTVTEIYDYMRLLWARVGIPYSPATGLPIESQTVSQMVDRMLDAAREDAALPAGAGGARPQGRVPQGDRRVAEEGLSAPQDRRRNIYAIDEAPALDKKFKHDIDVVVDRIVVRADIAARLADISRDRARARGRASPSSNTPTRRTRRASRGASSSPRNSPARSRASRSPRSSRGCSRSTTRSAPARPAAASATRCGSTRRSSCRTRALTLQRGAIAPWAKSTSPYYGQTLEAIAQALQGHDDDAVGGAAGESAQARSSTAPATRRSASPTTTACAPMR